jgi:hypothetical protein
MRTLLIASFGLATLLTTTSFVMADDTPNIDVGPVCRGIASQAGNPTEKGGPDLTFKDCVTSEQEVRKELAKIWSTFADADKGHCVRLARTGGESSYTELITCLEMARDVRQLHSTAAKGIN